MAEPSEDVVAGLLAARARVVSDAEPGTTAACELAHVTDQAVSALAGAAFASFDGRWAVVAAGAYGASRLLPYSDIDLLVLSEAPPRQLKPCVEKLLYPLWDAGLEVGHQVRSRSEHLKMAAQDTEILTASLTGRPLAGDVAYANETLTEVARRAARKRRQIVATLELRRRAGSPFLLEPDLKEGVGGQRDIDELVWRASLLGSAPAFDAIGLCDSGALSREDFERLTAAQDEITATRWRVQRATGRKTSRLTLDIADDAAGSHLHEALSHVAGSLEQVRAGTAVDDGAGWDAERIFDALAAGSDTLPALSHAAAKGALDALLPGLSAMMMLRRPGLGHRFTVGAHMLRAAALVAEVGADDMIAREVLRTTADPRPLLVAALTHDAGKATPGAGHAERSVPVTRALAERVGLDEKGTLRAETLVREHLLLAETAATSDPQDDDVVLDVAARVGDVETLGLLYVLTAADSLATGPSSWTRWHAALVGSLLGTVDTALTEPEAATIADRAQLVRVEALELMPSGSALASIVRAMHYRYLVSRDPRTIVSDAGLVHTVHTHSSGMPLDFRVATGPVPDSYRVTVAVPDRHGIFATIAGCLTLAGLDIMDAEAHDVAGAALDEFIVTSATSAAVEPQTWTRFERELRAALQGNLALETRLEERRAHYSSAEKDARVAVECDTHSPRVTSVRVTAPDRVGLLHDIAAEVARAGLTIVRARALVRDGMAVDTFVVTDASGEPPRDPGLLGHLAMGIRERCD